VKRVVDGSRIMHVHVIIPSINQLLGVRALKPLLEKNDTKVIIIDEGDQKLRKNNRTFISEIRHEFYGPQERAEWFKKHFGSSYETYLHVIPERCHAETSFGFLMAYAEQPDLVIELDDDVFVIDGQDFVDLHHENIEGNFGITVESKGSWYNSMENLELSTDAEVFPRGYPYVPDARNAEYKWLDKGGKCVLNMGLWAGNPDLDALTFLYHGGFAGECHIRGVRCKRKKVIVAKGTYFPVCSMNTAFVPKIIPAFYQLYMNHMGVNRFDDIWSGILLKKIADHMGDKMCLGEPTVYHYRGPRDPFKQLMMEWDGIVINEILWRIVDSLPLDGETYWDAYNSFMHEFGRSIAKTTLAPLHKKFIRTQIEKMRLWLKTVDKLE